MTNQEKYVVQSLELHLFFARIMKEHSLFLEAGFTPKNADMAKEADNFKLKFESVLHNTVMLSDGLISPEILSSGEIITDFTLGTEEKTQNFTGIPINKNITVMESKLRSGNRMTVSSEKTELVKKLNKEAKTHLDGLIAFKTLIINSVLSCNLFTANYPLLIEHILREAKLYRDYLESIERGEDINEKDMKQTELFWNQIMLEHALFIRGLLDPSENMLIRTANNFAFEYDELLKSTMQATDATLAGITDAALKETMKYKEFKTAGTKGISECKIHSIILPLLADHVLREANHYIRLLKSMP